MKKKVSIAVVALALVLCFTIGGTLAWLMDTTDPVQNTFTSGDVDITLVETPNTDTDNDGIADSWSAQMIPGNTYAKNPKVTVTDSTDVDCWLFVRFEENGNAGTYLTYTSTLTTENGWTQGNGNDIPLNVWYREVSKDANTKSWELLVANTVTVKDSVTKGNMAKAQEAELVFTAYAAQKDNLTAEAAWALFNQN